MRHLHIKLLQTTYVTPANMFSVFIMASTLIAFSLGEDDFQCTASNSYIQPVCDDDVMPGATSDTAARVTRKCIFICFGENSYNEITNIHLAEVKVLNFHINSDASAKTTQIFKGNTMPNLESIRGNANSDDNFASSQSEIIIMGSVAGTLKYIGNNAFETYQGDFYLMGNFPNLVSIGDFAFAHMHSDYDNLRNIDIELSNLDSLQNIGDRAFSYFPGTLKIDVPSGLETLKQHAFDYAGDSESEFNATAGLSQLVAFEKSVFEGFKGKINIEGQLLLLETIEKHAFLNVKHADGVLNFNESPQLKTIQEYAFNGVESKVLMRGSFTNLETIENYAFQRLKGGSEISFANGLPKLVNIGTQCFNQFGGTEIEFKGDFPKLSLFNFAFQGVYSKLTLEGTFPLLQQIEDDAFNELDGSPPSAEQKVKMAQSSLKFDNLAELTQLSGDAFDSYHGSLELKGDFPKLETLIGTFNIQNLQSGSEINFSTGLPKLTVFTDDLFNGFTGKIQLNGEFPELVSIGDNAFRDCGDAASTLQFSNLPLLESVGEQSFTDFKGQVTFSGTFPRLSSIDENAFAQDDQGAGYVATVGITCSLLDSSINDFSGITNYLGSSNEASSCGVCSSIPCGAGQTSNGGICPGDSATCSIETCCTDNGTCDDFDCGLQVMGPSTHYGACNSLQCTNEECCVTYGMCSDLTCDAYSHTQDNPPEYCSDTVCDQTECCEANPTCDTFACEVNQYSKPAYTTCSSGVCTAEDCCNDNPSCGADYDCPEDMFNKQPGPQCSSTVCDNDDCCTSKSSCPSDICGSDKYLSAAANFLCETDTCTEDECCSARATCEQWTGSCSNNQRRSEVTDTECEGGTDTCSSACCVDKDSCGSVYDANDRDDLCSLGTVFNANHLCSSPNCVSDFDSSGLLECCRRKKKSSKGGLGAGATVGVVIAGLVGLGGLITCYSKRRRTVPQRTEGYEMLHSAFVGNNRA